MGTESSRVLADLKITPRGTTLKSAREPVPNLRASTRDPVTYKNYTVYLRWPLRGHLTALVKNMFGLKMKR